VLKGILTLSVTNYPYTLVQSDIEVSIVSQSNSSLVRYINVIEVGNDSGNQYIKVKFGGSESGLYDVFVRAKSYGRFDSTGVTLRTIGVVTSFSPNQGSLFGGTLITVTGYNFSTDIQDNPIRIGYTDCLVESSTNTQIICRTTPRVQETVGTDDFIVLLKTYEEAVCQVNPCTFTWVNTAALTTYSTAFDTTLNDYVLTLTGTSFGASLTNTKVIIDGFEQTVVDASDTQVKVQITKILNTTTLNTKFYLPVGIPDGTTDLKMSTGLFFNPILLSVSPNIGSPGGSLIQAVVKGVGINTKGLSLFTTVNGADVDICISAQVVSYGVLQCLTKALAVVDAPLKVKFIGSTTAFTCQGSAANSCNYQTSTTMPTVSAVSMTSSTSLQIAGAGF
jgi:hypothetical protein